MGRTSNDQFPPLKDRARVIALALSSSRRIERRLPRYGRSEAAKKAKSPDILWRIPVSDKSAKLGRNRRPGSVDPVAHATAP